MAELRMQYSAYCVNCHHHCRKHKWNFCVYYSRMRHCDCKAFESTLEFTLIGPSELL